MAVLKYRDPGTGVWTVFPAGTSIGGPPGPQGNPGPTGPTGPNGNFGATELGATENLNDIIVPGLYTQSSNAEASGGLNYPGVNAYAGLLEVFSNTNNSTPNNMIWQRYTFYATSSYPNFWFQRAYYNGTWQSWVQMGPPEILCSLVDNTQRDLPNSFAKYTSWTVEHDPYGRYAGSGNITVPPGAIKVRVTASLMFGSISQRRFFQIEEGTGAPNSGNERARWEGPVSGYCGGSLDRVMPVTAGTSFFLSTYTTGGSVSGGIRGDWSPTSFSVEAIYC
jgi:hypothetical protein